MNLKNKIENVIAIDGPAGSGKSTIAKIIARRLGFEYLDSGAIYRAVTYYLIDKGIDVMEPNSVIAELGNIELTVQNGIYKINDIDLTSHLREKKVTEFVPKVSKIKEVREKLLEIQHNSIANNKGVVIDGRDIGSVVFPNAVFKFYLTATAAERARRRVGDIFEEVSAEEVKKQIMRRDEEDMNRKISPLIQADDALYIDSTNMNVEEVARKIEEYYNYYFFLKKRRHIGYFFTYYCKPLVRALFKFKVEPQDPYPAKSPVLIASNHLSNLDPYLLGWAIKGPIYYLAKKELFKTPLLNFFFAKIFTAIPVKRGIIDNAAINRLILIVKAGHSVTIFPEGTRSKNGQPGKGKAGFGMLARKLGVPVLPVRIYGSDKALPRGTAIPVHTPINVRVGKEIEPAAFNGFPDNKDGYKQITEYVMDRITEL